MLHSGDYFSPTFDGIADLQNTKPVLTSWFQCASVSLFGYNELGIRLPSALAGIAIVFILFTYIKRTFQSDLFAWLTVLILLSSQGFTGFHASRTGDSDIFLSLFLLLSCMYFMKAVYQENGRSIFFSALFLSLAFSTKAFAALLFLPGFIAILFLRKQFMQTVKSKWYWLGFLVFSGAVVFLFGMREYNSPGYLNVLFGSDAGRLFAAVPDHQQDILFYLDQLMQTRFSFAWVLVLMSATILVLKSKNAILTGWLILAVSYLLIITFSSTKLYWYDLPLYPILSMLAAYTLFYFAENLLGSEPFSFRKQSAILVILFVLPCYFAFNRSQSNSLPLGERALEANEQFLFKRNLQGKDLNGLKVYFYGWKGGLLFYKYKLQGQDQQLLLMNQPKFAAGDHVLVCHDSLKQVLVNRFAIKKIDEEGNAELFEILSSH